MRSPLRFGLALSLGLALSGCVVRAGGELPPDGGIPDVEKFASTGEALDSVSAAGVMDPSELRRALHHHEDLLSDVSLLLEERPDDALLRHQKAYLGRSVEFYTEQLELSTLIEDASAENRPGLASRIYASQRAYLTDVAALNQDLEFPSLMESPIAIGPVAGPALVEEDLGADLRIDEAELRRMYVDGRYQEVVSLVAEAMAGDEQLSNESRALYALSLAEEGLLTEAISQAERLGAEAMVDARMMDARVGHSLWLMQTGHRDEAEGVLRAVEADTQTGEAALAQTRKVAGAMLREMTSSARDPRLVDARRAMEKEDFRSARRILEALLVSDAPQDVKKRGEALLGQMSADEEKAFERRVEDIRGLISLAGGAAQAKLRLEGVKTDFPGPRYEPRIKALEAELEGSASATEVDQMEQLAVAQSYLAQDRYEEAADAFFVLYGTESAEQARVGRERAIELYVHKVREDTARDYLAARRIKDADRRLAALNTIYGRLETVSKRYPESSMIPKINNHMEVVRQDILLIDPHYFDPPGGSEPAPAEAPE